MIKIFSTKKQKIGKVGEVLALQYIKNKGFVSCETNYSNGNGEIDIISTNKDKLVFFEVKTLQYRSKELLNKSLECQIDSPSRNFTFKKLFHMKQCIQGYLHLNNVSHETNIEIVLIEVRLVGNCFDSHDSTKSIYKRAREIPEYISINMQSIFE